jgi:putative hydrolase of the HAD superfamily
VNQPSANHEHAWRILCECQAVLLDLNGTIMFGHDRLDDGQDFAATYQRLGGSQLDPAFVVAAVRACVHELTRRYDDPLAEDHFPTVEEVLGDVVGNVGLSTTESGRLVDVMALHECGSIDNRHAAIVQRLARTHRVGVVTNIWSPKTRWIDELRRVQLWDLLGAAVFSSDTRSVKPSPVLFAKALHQLGIATERACQVLFIGDSSSRDICGAQQVGMRTILVADATETMRGGARAPDAQIESFLELEHGPSG